MCSLFFVVCAECRNQTACREILEQSITRASSGFGLSVSIGALIIEEIVMRLQRV